MHVVLHGDDLQELVAIGFLDFFDGVSYVASSDTYGESSILS